MSDAPPNEKLKYWLEFAKWFIVSVVIVVATLIIDSGFKDRAAGVVEINAYDKYVTDLIVLNKEVGPRRLLAQYFSHVTASDKLRARWVDYYNVLDKEYTLIAERDSTLAREQRALALKVNLTKADSLREKEINMKRMMIEQQLFTPVVPLQQPETRPADASAATSLERRGLELLAEKNIDGAIEAFEQAEQSYSGYHQVFEIARFLKSNKDMLNSPDSAAVWDEAMKHIATNLNYGMPDRERERLLMKVRR
ncbi:MAG: hypothetical protein WAU70_04985 [Flavobacteriales bacterium]